MANEIRYVRAGAAAGGNGTTNELTSGDGTHAYDTLANWQTAEAKDLTAATGIEGLHTVRLQSEWEDPLGSLVLNNVAWVTDEDYYIQMEVPLANRHNARRDGSWMGYIDVRVPYTRLVGLAMSRSHLTSSTAWVEGIGTRFIDCISLATGGGMAYEIRPDTTGVVLQNCFGLAHNNRCVQSSESAYVINSTLISLTEYAYRRSSGWAHNLWNCYLYGGDNSTGITKHNCLDGTDAAFTTANFVNVTSEEEDLNLVEGSGLRNQGSDQSANSYWIGAAVDYRGTERPQDTAWDVGAHEFEVAAPTLFPRILYGP